MNKYYWKFFLNCYSLTPDWFEFGEKEGEVNKSVNDSFQKFYFEKKKTCMISFCMIDHYEEVLLAFSVLKTLLTRQN